MGQVVSLNFHQTFKPETQYIAAILEIADGAEYRNVKDISALTGIPNGKSSGKVEPHIYYASFMGLVDWDKQDGDYKLSRTQLGEIVYQEDPGLQEELTILLCHSMMQREEKGAPLWSTVFKKILPSYKAGIKKDLLLKELENALDGKVTTKNVAPFFGSYDSFFDCLRVLTDNNETIELGEMPYNKEFIFVYAITLLEYWNEHYKNQDEISSVQFEQLHFGTVFGWNMQTEYEVLECLADADIIRMNRQLMPYTILRLANADDLVGELYSELC